MSLRQQLLELDAQRRQAMINADSQFLEYVFAPDLTWTHSSGVTESKADVIAAIVTGSVTYLALAVEMDRVRIVGDALIHNGILRGRASRDGQEKALNAKFLALWCVTDGQLRMVAWQSTNCSE